MPCGLCERWIEEEPLIQLYWDGGVVEGRRLSGDRLFVLSTEYINNGVAAARVLEDHVAALWCVERYRVHADCWLLRDGDWRPAVLRIRGEWLRWRYCFCEYSGFTCWDTQTGLASHLPKCITYDNVSRTHLSRSWLPIPWYFICEACQRERRQEDAGWSYENINADVIDWTASPTDD